MAELSSTIAAVKGHSDRRPSLRAREGVLQPAKLPAGRQKNDPPNKLYDIEVVEEAGDRVKIHYTGYSDNFDEWIERRDIVYRPPSRQLDLSQSLPFSLLEVLASSIKQKLWPSRVQDPEVKIYLSYSTEELASHAKGVGVVRGCQQYTIDRYSALTPILGEQWYLRIVNNRGDYSFIILETILFHLLRPKPLLDYAAEMSDDGSMTFTPAYIEQAPCLSFRFVRGDRNSHKLRDIL